MGMQSLLEQHVKAAQDIITAATTEDRDLTEAEQKSVDEALDQAEAIKTRVKAAQANTERLTGLLDAGGTPDAGDAEEDTHAKGSSFGSRFVKAKGYLAFKAANPDPGARVMHVDIPGSRMASLKEMRLFKKAVALGTDLAHLQNVRLPMVDQVARPELTLLDLISTGTTSGAFEYLQILAIQRGAAIVPENTGDDETDVRKPESSFTTSLETAKVYDYADGYTVTNQLLQDDQALASYLDNEFSYSFDAVLADKLLNGTGVNGEPKGLLNTTGVQQKSYTGTSAMDLIVAVRQSITLLKHVGATNLSVLVSPEDAEAIDLLRDANERFYGAGPFGVGPSTLWNRAIVESEQLEQGQTIVGDFKQISLLDRSGLSVQAFNQHKDYASRNLTYVRAELRAAQAIWRPNRFAVIEKA
jgi:HK97 family phage major capsid protein